MKFKIRIVKYTVIDTDYYIATNLYDRNEYTIDKLKQIYHDRWEAEEYFKHIKKHTKTDRINGNTYDDLCKKTYMQELKAQRDDTFRKVIGLNYYFLVLCTDGIEYKNKIRKY